MITVFWGGIDSKAANDQQIIYGEVVDLSDFEYNSEISLFSEEDHTLELNSGNHEKWIDRIDVPDYADTLYQTLVEYTDNDGVDDLMIDDSGYSKETATVVNYGEPYGCDYVHVIKFVTIENPTDSDMSYAFSVMRAVYDAFDMDHPEVFWLSGSSYGYINRSATATGYTDTYYFLIKMHEGSYLGEFDVRSGNYPDETSIKSDIEVRDHAVEEILNTDAVKNASNTYEKVKALNEWLTMHNEYNMDVYGNGYSERTKAHKCISALTGGTGDNRPVCEGYSKAFKVLCDQLEIPCVITTGNAYVTPGAEPESHSWNCVGMENDKWYSVDVTWNDPAATNNDVAVSGYENENYLLVGEDTVISGMAFKDSHVTTNVLSLNGLSFSNEPVLCSDQYIYEPEKEPVNTNEVFRIAGATRYETSFSIADAYKEKLGVDQFDAVIIANGRNFADALAGSYLANVKNAPIFLYNNKKSNVADIAAYLKNNLSPEGQIYILGGTAAVGNDADILNTDYTVKRLSGADRYETNLIILKEAGITDQEILIATGKTFADSLSASATGRPILLVGNKLTDAQKEFLSSLNGNQLYILGGTSAVSAEMEKEIKAFGNITRISGTNRYETSVLIAQEFFETPEKAVLAYAKNFPDGLCGGSLAISMDAPLILTATGNNSSVAAEYIQAKGIFSGAILGGEGSEGNYLITDETAKEIFNLTEEQEIIYFSEF